MFTIRQRRYDFDHGKQQQQQQQQQMETKYLYTLINLIHEKQPEEFFVDFVKLARKHRVAFDIRSCDNKEFLALMYQYAGEDMQDYTYAQLRQDDSGIAPVDY